jgi:dienelactone hydrolase
MAMKSNFVPRVVCGILVLVLAAGAGLRAEDGASRSSRKAPVRHPGEAKHRHKHVARYEFGQGPRSYWIFEPADPKPERAPVVVFLHGWFSVNPAIYGGWIDHLVRSGNVVVFPRYQNDVGTMPQDFLPNALFAIHDAITVLETGEKHVRPDLKRFALIGHSAGGNLAAQIAAVSSDPRAGVPTVRAAMLFMPGEVLPLREPKLSLIPATTLLIVAVGEDDLLVGDLRGRQIFAQATAVPRSHKRYILFRSDRHGSPPLIAEHTAPTSANHRLDNGEGVLRSLQLSLGDVNALDWAGFWRTADATLDAAFSGRNLDEAITDEDAFTHLGYWSDGRRVTPPVMSDNLATVPRVILTNGIRLIPWEWPIKASDSTAPDAAAKADAVK